MLPFSFADGKPYSALQPSQQAFSASAAFALHASHCSSAGFVHFSSPQHSLAHESACSQQASTAGASAASASAGLFALPAQLNIATAAIMIANEKIFFIALILLSETFVICYAVANIGIRCVNPKK